MWVESDTNMPGGEAMARQFVAGKRFFLEEFGVEHRGGLAAGLLRLLGRAAADRCARPGSQWFLTQKISWNETNRMPHHTFWWEGIDGTRVFTHFPPVDTYNSRSVRRRTGARRAATTAEQGAATMSLVPFGYGDGGGGPTREMVARGAPAGARWRVRRR